MILASEYERDVGAVLTLAHRPEHRLGIVVEPVVSQAANRKGCAKLCWLAEDYSKSEQSYLVADPGGR